MNKVYTKHQGLSAVGPSEYRTYRLRLLFFQNRIMNKV
jgi:hypothetical protein